MQKIPKEELPKILPIKGGRDSQLRLNLLQLEVGEGLFMPNEEWKRKRPPYHVVKGLKKTHKYLFKYGRHKDGTGWLFQGIA